MYPPDVERFLEAVLRASRPERPADVEIESLYNRISREDDPEDGWQWFRRHRFWRLEAQPREYGALSQGPERFADVVEIGIAVTVTLPRADLPEAVAAMRAHNLSRGRDVGLDDYRA